MRRAIPKTTSTPPTVTATKTRWPATRRGFTLAGTGALAAWFAGWRTPAQALSTTRDITDMTWMEVRDAIKAGFGTVMVPSGGLEQNGPHMVIGKHDYIVAWAARRIAAEAQEAPPARVAGQSVLSVVNCPASVPVIAKLIGLLAWVPVLVIVTCWVPVSPGA